MTTRNAKSLQENRRLRPAALTVTCATLGLLAAGQVAANSGHGRALQEQNRAVRAELAQLEKAVSAFYSYDVARAAGWDTVISPCVESPMGGMGYHVANLDQLDELDELAGKQFSVSLLRPEVLLYAPMADGSMEFLGVEYIVPYTLDNASNPPSILGQEFQYNPQQKIWALHVWIARHNPAGIFAPFNPTVSCEFADDGGED